MAGGLAFFVFVLRLVSLHFFRLIMACLSASWFSTIRDQGCYGLLLRLRVLLSSCNFSMYFFELILFVGLLMARMAVEFLPVI